MFHEEIKRILQNQNKPVPIYSRFEKRLHYKSQKIK